MDRAHKSAIVFHVAEVVYSVLILVWYIFPLITPAEGLFSIPFMPFQLYGGPPVRLGGLILTSIVAYLVPILCLFTIASIFLERYIPAISSPTHTLPVVLSILNSVFVAGLIITHTFVFARSGHYFQASSPLTYVVLLASVGYNAYFIYLFIANLNKRNSAYGEVPPNYGRQDERPLHPHWPRNPAHAHLFLRTANLRDHPGPELSAPEGLQRNHPRLRDP